MKKSISEVKTNLSKLIQSLIDGEDSSIIITKNGKPVVQMTAVPKKNPNRVGAAKKEMKGFDISLEEFNSIPTPDFGQ